MPIRVFYIDKFYLEIKLFPTILYEVEPQRVDKLKLNIEFNSLRKLFFLN